MEGLEFCLVLKPKQPWFAINHWGFRIQRHRRYMAAVTSCAIDQLHFTSSRQTIEMDKSADFTRAAPTKEHYATLSDNYDSLFTEINNASMKIVEENLQLQPSDIVLDLGGGTGFIAEEMYKTGQLRSPVWCVDPSAAMIEVAKKRAGVVTAVFAGEDFFSAEKHIKFDKVLMNGVIHHFQDPVEIYRGVYEALKPNGLCLIINRQPPSILPFFEAGKESMNKSFVLHQDLVNQLKTAGFQSVVHYEDALEINVSKRRWYDMIRARFYSPLEPFNDQEIEAGIQELEDGLFKGIDLDSPISAFDFLFVVKVAKRHLKDTQ